MTGISTLGQALRQIENIKNQQTTLSGLSTQLATGKKTRNFSGLGTDALSSIRSRSDIISLDAYISNIGKADTRLKTMLSAIEEFQAQGNNLADGFVGFIQQGTHQLGDIVTYDDPATPFVHEETAVGMTTSTPDDELQGLINLSKKLYDYMTNLINTKDGDRYVLGGADTLTQPLNDTGTLDAAVSTLLTSWKNGTITTDQLLADIKDRTTANGNPDALTDSVIGYSATLSAGNAGRVFVRVDDNSELDYTVHGNEDPFRDIIVALSFLKNENLPPIADTYEDGVFPGTPDAQGAPGYTLDQQQQSFYTLYNQLTSMVTKALDQIDNVRFDLESVRASMNESKNFHVDQKNLFQSIVSDIEDVDTNEVALKLNTLQVQLEATFRVTALVSQLTLVNFI
ncbi:MAG: hypothetical protein H6858_08145 [Rhodospirillales bacterium]|nr:hypothetical protein [Rhodospirillales bacterium]